MALTQVPIELSSTPGIVDNSNATAITIDSSENVGIGTTSPAKTLQVSQGTNATATTIRIENTDTTIDAAQTANAIEFYTNDASTGGTGVTGKISHVAVNAGSTYALAFSSYNGSSLSEAMRIDDSGNILAGKTSADNTTAGTTIYGPVAKGAASFVRDAGNTLVLNRLTSDGEILAFRKDSSTAGSIGVKNSDLTVGTGDTGLRFTDSTNQIWAVDTTDGSSRDAAVDLGNSSVRFKVLYLSGGIHNGTNAIAFSGGAFAGDGAGNDANIDLGRNNRRFKDLYLSGGAYLGGTGSANKLDDYEEGTWTPYLASNGTAPTVTSYTNRVGKYTKVGDLLYVSCFIRAELSSAGTGTPRVSGFPYNTLSGIYQPVYIGLINMLNNGTDAQPYSYGGNFVQFDGGTSYQTSLNSYLCFSAVFKV